MICTQRVVPEAGATSSSFGDRRACVARSSDLCADVFWMRSDGYNRNHHVWEPLHATVCSKQVTTPCVCADNGGSREPKVQS